MNHHKDYASMPFEHETVTHSVRGNIGGMVHTDGIESFRALLKCRFKGTYHHILVSRLEDRHVTEFDGQYNSRPTITDRQMPITAQEMERILLGNCGLFA